MSTQKMRIFYMQLHYSKIITCFDFGNVKRCSQECVFYFQHFVPHICWSF